MHVACVVVEVAPRIDWGLEVQVWDGEKPRSSVAPLLVT